jgi:hypothetical protein
VGGRGGGVVSLGNSVICVDRLHFMIKHIPLENTEQSALVHLILFKNLFSLCIFVMISGKIYFFYRKIGLILFQVISKPKP